MTVGAHHPNLGRTIEELATPSLLVDLDVFEANCRTMASHMASRGVGWRPHVKAAKSPILARRMLEAGAFGVTCAKVGEAEEMVAGGITDVLVANQPSTPEAWARLARLQKAANVAAAVDDPVHVEMAVVAGGHAGVSVPLVIEVDIGMGRAGTRSSAEAVALARLIVSSEASFAGVMGYEGHLLAIEPEEEKRAQIEKAVGIVVTAAEAIRAESIDVGIVSCGGTGSYHISADIEGVTEIQAGGGALMDRFYREMCNVDLDQALFLVASVGSIPEAGQAILDAGWKALPDRLIDPGCHDLAGGVVAQLYAEHARLEYPEDAGLEIGDRVVLVPGYSDATTVLHNEFLGVRDGVVVEVIPLVARGVLT